MNKIVWCVKCGSVFRKMDSLETPFQRVPTTKIPMYVGVLVCVHLLLMLMLLILVGLMVPELGTTLHDVNTMVPQMTLTLRELGKMLPDIRDGMKIMDALCAVEPECHVS